MHFQGERNFLTSPKPECKEVVVLKLTLSNEAYKYYQGL